MMPKLWALALLFAPPLAPPAAPDAARPAGGREALAPPVPKPELTPQQVVRTVVDALKHNDEPHADAGIETAFAFASTANKEATGPLERFIPMVKGPSYRTMLKHRSAEFGPMKVEGDMAVQRVKMTGAVGESVDYGFILSKDPKTGCWMTDGVVVIPPPTERRRVDEA